MFISCTNLHEQNNAINEIDKKIENYIQKVIDKFEIPGLTIAIVQDDRIYTSAFGLRNLNTSEPMKPEYIFHMASVSKPFVATAVMQLVEQGKMNLDESVVTYLPYFKLADERYKEITIRQMLNHTSGMPDVEDYEWDNPKFDDGAAERYVRSLTSEIMIADPGQQWRYSNMAFDVLGDVISKVSGQPFEKYVKKNILDPLDMKESNFLREEISDKLRTSPHVWQLKPVVCEIYPYNRRHAPSSTLNSSVVEMVNWANANLNKGEFKGKRILSPQSYDLLWGSTVQVNDRYNIGLSWFSGTHRDLPTIFHSGGDTGYRSKLILLPEKRIAVIVASNYYSTPMEEIVEGVLDILLGYKPEIPKRSIERAFAEVYNRSGIDTAKAFYHRVNMEAKDEYDFNNSGSKINSIGHLFLAKDQVEQAIEIFHFNSEVHPKSYIVYDGLGEAYMLYGNNDLAIENYQKSFKLNPQNNIAIEVLKNLGVELEYPPKRQITLVVKPAIMPVDSKIYVTGNHENMGNWNPNTIPLEQQTDGTWRRTITIEEGMYLEFKITRGKWDDEAVSKEGIIPPNNILEVKNDTTLMIMVENWKDIAKQE
jgi:CubicO group peptidase (beta-lactamase class C family)